MSLSKEQLNRIERRLTDEHRRIEHELDRSAREQSDEDLQERAGDLTKVPLHPADLGTDTIDDELETSNETRMSRELAAIDDALERLRTAPDRFGVCEDTGKEIPFARLEIIPWARTCAEADA